MLTPSRRIYEDVYGTIEHPLLYTSPWWWDAVCGKDKWETIAIKNADTGITACMPFYKTRVGRMKAVITPPLTQWISILQAHPLSAFNLSDFFQTLPSVSILDVSLKQDQCLQPPSSGYQFNLKYSFLLPVAENYDQIKSRYNEGLRRNLREAEKDFSLKASSDVTTLLRLCTASFHQRKMPPPPWLNTILPAAYQALVHHGRGEITFAFQEDKPIAGILTGWDDRSTYYLQGGRIAGEGGTSAHALLLDHAILNAQAAGRSFDFEGSMHPGIANFFQSFGATPESYWQIRKFKGPGKLWALFH